MTLALVLDGPGAIVNGSVVAHVAAVVPLGVGGAVLSSWSHGVRRGQGHESVVGRVPRAAGGTDAAMAATQAAPVRTTLLATGSSR